MYRSAFLLVLASAISAPAFAADPAPVSGAVKPVQKQICRFANSTGSRLRGERICKTRTEWEEISRETGEQLEKGLRRPTGDPGNGPH